ncbi:hypothetical protein [Kumtagia ephedrae]|uniref:Uncharacterized protein n=1 Tax=Kumtagia ephedrae TaxID=2116701 RepID=A0A2P7SGU9_9HYPH|nr:hypothetical protein [Mesorhizobium ephedrae]PSJ61697.1 hypothetical protein C7I84_08810 [Mesorhizobium ephedrae]
MIGMDDDDFGGDGRWQYMTPDMREMFADALRLSASNSGAPQRCRRKACQRSGRCCVKLDAEGDGTCFGGMTEQTAKEAAMMIVFAMTLWEKRTGIPLRDGARLALPK